MTPCWTLGVLAGGASRRFGGDKALAAFGKGTLIEWMVERCSSGQVLISVASRDRALPPSLDAVPRVVDEEGGGRGPLDGVITLLARTPAPWLAVVPCDMPFLLQRHIATLVGDAAASGATQAYYVSPPDVLETFPLVLHRRALDLLRARRTAGDMRVLVTDADSLGVDVMARHPRDAPRLFRNLNTREDWQSATLDLLSRPPGAPLSEA